MIAQLRATLWLLLLTVLLCAVLYPLVLLGIGQTILRGKAEGSLIDARGELTTDPTKAVGSRLIAQPFSGDEYFQPRPSAVSYNAAASGASNWGASNPALRERVLQSLGPILKYRNGEPVGPYVEKWFRAADEERALAGVEPLTAEWSRAHPTAAAGWVQGHIREAFFEAWWRANPHADLEPVPADMVMASGSGLDPDITLRAAQYQLDRVAGKAAELTGRDRAEERRAIEAMLHSNAEAPFGGLAGVKLINVLEINVALHDHYEQARRPGR